METIQNFFEKMIGISAEKNQQTEEPEKSLKKSEEKVDSFDVAIAICGSNENPDLGTIALSTKIDNIQNKDFANAWNKFKCFYLKNSLKTFQDLKVYLSNRFSNLESNQNGINHEEMLFIFYIFWRCDLRMQDSRKLVKEFVGVCLSD